MTSEFVNLNGIIKFTGLGLNLPTSQIKFNKAVILGEWLEFWYIPRRKSLFGLNVCKITYHFIHHNYRFKL